MKDRIKKSIKWYIIICVYILSCIINYQYVKSLYGQGGRREGNSIPAIYPVITYVPIVNTVSVIAIGMIEVGNILSDGDCSEIYGIKKN